VPRTVLTFVDEDKTVRYSGDIRGEGIMAKS